MATTKKAGRHIFGGDAFLITLANVGNQAAADGVAKFQVPFDLTIISGHISVKTGGDTSGATTVTLSVGATDLNSSAASIAHDASPEIADITFDTQNTLDAGDILEVDVDAIPGGTTSVDLTVHLWCERRLGR